MKARRIARDEIPQTAGKVVDEGGTLRTLDGGPHGLQVSIMDSVVVPGGGPRRHRHPHAEVFVVHQGSGRFEVDGERLDGGPGDMVIIPPGAWHAFTNAGQAPLRVVAVHESPQAVIEWEDGTRRD